MAPNYGNNDGAHIFPLSECDFRDMRPAVQAAYFVATRKRLLESGPWDEELHWLMGSEAADRNNDQTRSDLRLESQAFDVGGYYTLRDTAAAARIATLGRPETKIVFILQDTAPWMLRRRYRRIQQCLYRATDLIFVSSLGFKDQLLCKFGLVESGKPIVFVPNVTFDSQFRNFAPRAAGDSLTVGYVGLLRGKEGLEALVEAVAKARQKGADIRVLFAGKGPSEDFVKEVAERFEFAEYLGPYRHNEEIREIYGKVDVLYGVYDRSYDKKIHLAYRFCEAVNCRMPIIVAEDTHMCEEAQRYGVGFCVPLGDVDRLAEELVKLCKSREMRSEFARNCERARSEFVFEHYEERICRAYDELWNM